MALRKTRLGCVRGRIVLAAARLTCQSACSMHNFMRRSLNGYLIRTSRSPGEWIVEHPPPRTLVEIAANDLCGLLGHCKLLLMLGLHNLHLCFSAASVASRPRLPPRCSSLANIVFPGRDRLRCNDDHESACHPASVSLPGTGAIVRLHLNGPTQDPTRTGTKDSVCFSRLSQCTAPGLSSIW